MKLQDFNRLKALDLKTQKDLLADFESKFEDENGQGDEAHDHALRTIIFNLKSNIKEVSVTKLLDEVL